MRRVTSLLALAAAVVGLSGCQLPDLRPYPPGPPRYLDEMFSAVDITSNVVYGQAVDQQGVLVTLRLDLYRPSGDTITARPAIVWVHGGGFSGGDKSSSEIVDEATTFAKKGFVTVSINYRLYPPGCSAGAPTPGCAQAIVDARHDAQAAVRFLRANAAGYAIDPDRIAIGGSSAGAIIALETGFTPEDPGDSGNPGYDSAVRATVSLSGALILGTVNRSDAPSLLFHGTNDTVVPYDWARTTFLQAYSIALDSFLITFPGGGHVPYAQHRTQILEETSNFLYWELNLGYAAQ